MKQDFQAGVDSIYNAIVAAGATPSSKNPADIANSITNNLSNASLGNLVSSGKVNIATGSIAYPGNIVIAASYGASGNAYYPNIGGTNIDNECKAISTGTRIGFVRNTGWPDGHIGCAAYLIHTTCNVSGVLVIS